MPAIAAIVLQDGQSTPANHTFAPVNKDSSGVAKWTDRSSGIAIGFPVITLSLQEPQKGSRNYKVVRKVTLPVMDITSPATSTGIQPAPSKAFELTCVSTWTLPERSTEAQRADLFAFAQNFDATAAFKGNVLNFETVYGG